LNLSTIEGRGFLSLTQRASDFICACFYDLSNAIFW